MNEDDCDKWVCICNWLIAKLEEDREQVNSGDGSVERDNY